MFRRKSTGTLRAMRHDERLAALGAILDDRHFVLDGLSILASGEGFIVVGYAAMTQGAQAQLMQQTLEITKPMLEAALGRR